MPLKHMYIGNRSLEGTLRKNFRENTIGCNKILDLTLLFPDIGAAVGALYLLTNCNDAFNETCTYDLYLDHAQNPVVAYLVEGKAVRISR